MRTIAVTRDTVVPASRAAALATIWNLQYLDAYEPKVDVVDVTREVALDTEYRWKVRFRARGE